MRHIYRSAGIRSGARSLLRSRILCVFCTVGVVWRFVTWRRSVAKNEGRWPILSQKRRIHFVESHIYRSEGIPSDPQALLWPRIFYLFGTFGVVCRFFIWRRAVAKNDGRWARLSQKRRILVSKRYIYRSVEVRSFPRALLWSRILCVFCTVGVVWRFVT